METETSLNQVEELLKPWTRWTKRVQPHVLTVSISRNHLLKAVETLQKAGWGYLSAITGLHLPGVERTASEEKQWSRLADDNIHSQPPALGDSFVILYHFCHGGAVLDLRVHPPSLEDNTVPSLTGLIPSAVLYERELQEMFGVTVENLPDTAHFLLPDDWPDGVYPLRKDFTGLPEESRARGD